MKFLGFRAGVSEWSASGSSELDRSSLIEMLFPGPPGSNDPDVFEKTDSSWERLGMITFTFVDAQWSRACLLDFLFNQFRAQPRQSSLCNTYSLREAFWHSFRHHREEISWANEHGKHRIFLFFFFFGCLNRSLSATAIADREKAATNRQASWWIRRLNQANRRDRVVAE